jgi:tetratricopeptide (TPR) repeat protein
MNRLFVLLLAMTIQGAAVAQAPAVKTYERALELVHAYSGSGPELQQAMEIADGLSKSAPESGYAQVLQAEALSTWRLNQEGTPVEVRNWVLSLADEALRLNPKLAQAHVSKARALVRSSMYDRAGASIDAALAIDPNLSGAIFLRAEVFRRNRAIADADIWYQKFIDSTTSNSRKANGYAWIGTMYQDASWNDDVNRAKYVAKARAAYESMLKYEPGGAWRNVNFAIFLNEYAGDFDAAELYATKALGMMEFPMARYHLAAARYQKLAAASSSMTPAEIRNAAKNVAESTRISLEEAIAFDAFSQRLVSRLSKLQQRVAAR